MTGAYKEIVSGQILEIVKNISFNGNDLLDVTANPQEIAIAILKYNVHGFDKSLKKKFKEVLLSNWIYCRYYQNRGEEIPETDKVDEPHFPFKQMFQKGGEAYWRNRFWYYDDQMQERDRAILTKGYESRYAKPQQFVQDDFIFETFGDPEKSSFKEVSYLSMVFPKFEIGKEQKFAFGKYPLDDDGQGGIIRFYFHLDTQRLDLSIPSILTKISKYFNTCLIPFQIKFFSKATDFIRADHFILYVERRHFFIAGMLLNYIYDEIKIFLDVRKLPFFVREVLPGIGVAEDPAKEFLSFGFLRSRLIAKAILKKFENSAVDPAFDYLNEIWGGIENFYLNPKTCFAYDFDIFNKKNTILFEDIKADDALSAAWYIARLFCREAIWIEEGQCNWLSYREIEEKRLGYGLLKVDNGVEGLEGVIVFLRSFQEIGIRDTIIEYILAGAERFFYEQKGQELIVKGDTTTLAIPKNKIAKSGEFSIEELRFELEKVITAENLPRLSDLKLLQNIMTDHIPNERPICNGLDGSDHFCADMRYGFAGYGYAYLRLSDPVRIVRLNGIQF